MTGVRQSLGRRGEDLAADLLAREGYELLDRNWRSPGGEIDLVARQGDTLVIVEVRARRGRSFGTPQESVTPRKQARLIALAQAYADHREWPGALRIDVVAVQFSAGGRLETIDHIENAVSA